MKEHSPDILGLQETKLQEDQIPQEIHNLSESYNIFFDHAEKRGYSGTSIFSTIEPIEVTNKIGNPEFETEGRITCAEYDKFFFINMYFPYGRDKDNRLDFKLRFYDQTLIFMNKLREETGKHIILAGDINTAHYDIDITSPRVNEKYSGFLPIEREWLDKLVATGYVDTFREFNKEPYQYSWWSFRNDSRNRNAGWRIDYVFVNEELLPYVKDAFILQNVYGSDHCPVGIELDIDKLK